MNKGEVRCGVLRPTPISRQAFPSRNQQLIESPYQWLKDKREVVLVVLSNCLDDLLLTLQVDSAAVGIPPNLWAIRGKLYDLNQFVERHPGGPEWLSMTRGSDITDFYEVSCSSRVLTDEEGASSKRRKD